MNDKNLKPVEKKNLSSDLTHDPGRFISPAVDIFETDEGLTLIADMPGMNKTDLKVDVDKGILTIEGKTPGEMAGTHIWGEFSSLGYYRQFRLPEQIEGDKAEAELKDGVLTLMLPKAEAAKPKRIEIRTVH